MKKFLKKTVISVLLGGVLLFAMPAVPALAASGTWYTIDMNTAAARVMTAHGAANRTQSLAGMAQDNNAFAAINGTYFNAYGGTPFPDGTVMRDGKLLHIGGGAVMGITSDGRLLIDRLDITINCTVNDAQTFKAWRINHDCETSDAIVLYTSEFAGQITPYAGGKAVLVGNDGTVSNITSSPFTVPAGGFAIMFNVDAKCNINVGDKVSYRPTFNTTYTSAADWENVQQALGAGPSLLINGNVTADPAAEGFQDSKIANSVPRSFIGNKANGEILIGRINSATPKDAAAYCQSLGLVNAMCLDGGGSINLYYDGKKVFTGRDINNGLGFIRQAEKPISVILNGSRLSFTQPPYVANDVTLVPMRAIFEALNASVDFDAAGRKITATKGETVIELVLGQKSAIKNGQTINLDVPADTRNGSTMVPLRFVAEALQAKVDWDNASRTITISTN